MMRMRILILNLFVNSGLCYAKEVPHKEDEEILYQREYLLILESTKNYEEAKILAKNASKGLKIKFDSYKSSIGNTNQNNYWPRRYPDNGLEKISIEDSVAYVYRKGYYLVLLCFYLN